MDMLSRNQKGFTVVELLIVIVVIAILAAITFVVYGGINSRAEIAVIESDLNRASKQLASDKIITEGFPLSIASANGGQGLSASTGITYEYTGSSSAYCLTATKGNKAYYTTNTGGFQEGACTGHTAPGGGGAIADGVTIQTITAANCPTARTRAVDARDNHTYWVQKLADSKCWMLTNLAYAGGGTNTYADIKTLTNGTGGSSSYTVPSYYIVPVNTSGNTVSYTTEPTAPSATTNGSGQYGYHYNWCAAMGGQATSACANALSPATNASLSVCPSGWRLPTGNGGEFAALNTAINGVSTDAAAVTGLRTTWLGRHGGSWGFGNFYYGGMSGANSYYWSSTPQAGWAGRAYSLYYSDEGVSLNYPSMKNDGMSVRCVAV